MALVVEAECWMEIPGCARLLIHGCPHDSLLHQRYYHAKVDLHEVESNDPEVR